VRRVRPRQRPHRRTDFRINFGAEKTRPINLLALATRQHVVKDKLFQCLRSLTDPQRLWLFQRITMRRTESKILMAKKLYNRAMMPEPVTFSLAAWRMTRS
jgi:hypothetical protein